MASVVFDLGGVVLRWQPTVLVQDALHQKNLSPEAAQSIAQQIFQSFAPTADWAAFDLGVIEPDALAQAISRRSGLSVDDVSGVIHAVRDHLTPQPETLALIQRLKACGHRLFYLSNMPTPLALHLEQHHSFFDWFDGGIFSCRVTMMKPQPEIFSLAEQRFGLQPAQTLFIDDLAHNVEAARARAWQGLQFFSAEQCGLDLARGGWL